MRRGLIVLAVLTAVNLVVLAYFSKAGDLSAIRVAGYLQAFVLAGWLGEAFASGTDSVELTRAGWFNHLLRAAKGGCVAAVLAKAIDVLLAGGTYGATMFVTFPALTIAAAWIQLAVAREPFDEAADLG